MPHEQGLNGQIDDGRLHVWNQRCNLSDLPPSSSSEAMPSRRPCSLTTIYFRGRRFYRHISNTSFQIQPDLESLWPRARNRTAPFTHHFQLSIASKLSGRYQTVHLPTSAPYVARLSLSSNSISRSDHSRYPWRCLPNLSCG